MDGINSTSEHASALDDAERLDAIRHSGLLSGLNNAELDVIASLVSQVLDVPVALVSVVTEEKQVFPSSLGLPKPWDERGETPLSHSFCQYVVASGLPLQVDDAEKNAMVCDNLAINDLGVQAYLGTPIRDPDGFVLGSLCAIDTQPREWTSKDIGILDGFSASITTQLLARRAIADLDRSNRQLAVEKARLNRVAENASVYIAELSTDLIYTFSNKAYADLFGKSPQDILGCHPRDILGDKPFAIAKPHLEKALKGETTQYDLELPRSNLPARMLSVQYAPVESHSGQVDGLVVAIFDITDQHILNQNAERLESRLSAAHQTSPDGFMVFRAKRDPTDEIIDFEWEYSNDTGAKIADRPIDELIGNTLLSVLPGNKTEGLFDAYVEVVNTGQPFRQTSHYQQDGLSLWISISAIKLADGFAVSFRDVTKRKQSELAFEASAVRLQRILDNVVALIGVVSPDGLLKDVNQPALDVANLSRGDVIGKSFWDTFWWSFSEEAQARLKQAFDDGKGGKQSRYDAQIQIGKSDYVWIDFQLSPQFDDHGNLLEMIASGADITQRKQAEEHRELLVNELNHRVKNTLATIQAMARQTIRTAPDLASFEETFSARLAAISTAHNILVNSDNARADLDAMVGGQVGPYVDQSSQVKVSGGSITLDGECAHCVGLVLHEFATNAAKYGALSTKDGHVEIVCEDVGGGNIRIVWTELGGPLVVAPSRQGFGSRLIKQSIEYSLGGSADIDYRDTGVVATLVLPREFDHG